MRKKQEEEFTSLLQLKKHSNQKKKIKQSKKLSFLQTVEVKLKKYSWDEKKKKIKKEGTKREGWEEVVKRWKMHKSKNVLMQILVHKKYAALSPLDFFPSSHLKSKISDMIYRNLSHIKNSVSDKQVN